MDDKLIIGIVSAVGGGVFALLTALMSGRFKMREMEFKRMLEDSRTRLAAANKKLDDVYVPMMSYAEQCYRNWYVYQKTKDDDRKKLFFESIDNLRGFYETMVESGNTIYLIPDAREEVERLVRFLDASKGTTEWNILILRRMEGVGVRSITETIISGKKMPSAISQLFLARVTSFFLKLFSFEVIRINSELRTASAPIDDVPFAEEFNRIIDVLRISSTEVALYKNIEKPKVVSVGEAEQENAADAKGAG